MRSTFRLLFPLVASLALLGCETAPVHDATLSHPSPAEEARAHISKLRLAAPVPTSGAEEANLAAGSFAGLSEIDAAALERERAEWLRRISVTFTPDHPVSASAVVKGLMAKGVPIVSDVPLEGFTYAGPGVLRTDAETALRMLFPPMGLDYSLDHERHLVILHPWRSETFWVSFGRRNTSFASGAGAASSGSSSVGAGSDQAGGNDTAPSTVRADGDNTITVDDDFWPTLESELSARLQRCIPSSPATAMVPPVGGLAVAGAGIPPGLIQPGVAPASPEPSAGCRLQTFGHHAMHPDTGAVTVQAPQWLLAELRDYFAQVNAQYNTALEFAGRLFMYTHDRSRSSGVDLAAFADIASQYGFVVTNSALGAVFTPPESAGSPVSLIHSGLAGSTLGVVKENGALQLFSNFMEGTRRATLIDDPIARTTAGVPVRTRDATRIKVISLNQTAAGTDNGATATQNDESYEAIGTDLRINPLFDPRSGLIRAQVALLYRAQSGTQVVRRYLTTGDALREVETEEPVITEIEFSGEGLFRPGDMVLFSAKTLTLSSDSDSGTRGLKDGPLGFLFGTTGREERKVTFYFALEARSRPFTPFVARR